MLLFNLSIVLINILLVLSTIVPLLITIAFYTLAERKIIAAIQRRKGPNVVGIFGLLQPFADGLKLVIKEINIPIKSILGLFLFAPLFTLILSFLNWSLISFSNFDILIDLNFGLLVLFIFSSLNVYGIILAGWSSNSRYPFLGAVRSSSQIISYEVSLTIIFLTIALLTGSFNLIDIIYIQQQIGWFFLPLFPLLLIFFISILAETNRAPFDLPEAEAEIVAGYNLEYSSIVFAIFFLAEYNNIILISTLLIILFFGGWAVPFIGIELNSLIITNFIYELMFSFKIICICFLFVLIRATLPRLRYDQLIVLGWKIFLPLSSAFCIYVISYKLIFSNFISYIEFYI
jgi:NADH-quinone oxidoreductase subunit H